MALTIRLKFVLGASLASLSFILLVLAGILVSFTNAYYSASFARMSPTNGRFSMTALSMKSDVESFGIPVIVSNMDDISISFFEYLTKTYKLEVNVADPDAVVESISRNGNTITVVDTNELTKDMLEILDKVTRLKSKLLHHSFYAFNNDYINTNINQLKLILIIIIRRLVYI